MTQDAGNSNSGASHKRKAPKKPNSMKKRIERLENQVKEDPPELKNVQGSRAFGASVVAGLVDAITPVAQGIAVNQRIGDSIKMKGVSIELGVNNTAATSEFFRAIVFRWKGSASPVAADILQPGLGGAVPDVFSPYSTLNLKSGNLKVFADQRVSLTASLGDGCNQTIRIRKALGNTRATWSGPLAANVNNGQVYMFLISTNVNVQYGYTSNVIYVDP